MVHKLIVDLQSIKNYTFYYQSYITREDKD